MDHPNERIQMDEFIYHFKDIFRFLCLVRHGNVFIFQKKSVEYGFFYSQLVSDESGVRVQYAPSFLALNFVVRSAGFLVR